MTGNTTPAQFDVGRLQTPPPILPGVPRVDT